jgi:hypothetical protein
MNAERRMVLVSLALGLLIVASVSCMTGILIAAAQP